MKTCKKCKKYCCYTCLDCVLCEEHKLKYCCIKRPIYYLDYDKLFDYCNKHLHIMMENLGNIKSFIGFEFDKNKIDCNSPNTSIYYKRMLSPATGALRVNVYLNLTYFKITSSTSIDLYIDHYFVYLDLSKFIIRDDKQQITDFDNKGLDEEYLEKFRQIGILLEHVDNYNKDDNCYYKKNMVVYNVGKYCHQIRGGMNHNSFSTVDIKQSYGTIKYHITNKPNIINSNDYKNVYDNAVQTELVNTNEITEINDNTNFSIIGTTIIRDILKPTYP